MSSIFPLTTILNGTLAEGKNVAMATAITRFDKGYKELCNAASFNSLTQKSSIDNLKSFIIRAIFRSLLDHHQANDMK